MDLKNIILQKEGEIAILTFNRPEALNALNNQTRSEFREAINEIREDDTVKVVILAGAGRAFIAGSDLKELRDTRRSRRIT